MSAAAPAPGRGGTELQSILLRGLIPRMDIKLHELPGPSPPADGFQQPLAVGSTLIERAPKSPWRTRGLCSVDSEGVQKRRELLLEMMRKDRSRRREQGEAVSSTDEEQDTRRVDAELLGMARQARRPVESRRRNRGESEQLESLLMDPEVSK